MAAAVAYCLVRSSQTVMPKICRWKKKKKKCHQTTIASKVADAHHQIRHELTKATSMEMKIETQRDGLREERKKYYGNIRFMYSQTGGTPLPSAWGATWPFSLDFWIYWVLCVHIRVNLFGTQTKDGCENNSKCCFAAVQINATHNIPRKQIDGKFTRQKNTFSIMMLMQCDRCYALRITVTTVFSFIIGPALFGITIANARISEQRQQR